MRVSSFLVLFIHIVGPFAHDFWHVLLLVSDFSVDLDVLRQLHLVLNAFSYLYNSKHWLPIDVWVVVYQNVHCVVNETHSLDP